MIHDLCIIMLTAGIVSLLFKLLHQPVVLGYIVAGLIAGPYMCGQSWINDSQSLETWGEIGVLFLLFAMGLEFSFKKLLQMGSTVLIAAGTIIIGMMSVGFLTGRLLGWNEINSMFLGGMLCMSSTTIVFKAIEDLNLSSHKFAKVVFGILVVEDLFAVVLMVLLSSIAVEKKFQGGEMLFEIGKLIAYLIFWFVVGIAIIPTFLKKFRKHLNDETLTIFAIGMCLGMVLLAVSAGFSSALGAFVMGSVLAETIEAERIEHLVQPIKNVFGAIFFVSVGMMINPSLILTYWLPILVITLLVIAGQITFGSLGTLLSGQSLRVSLQSGFSLVQIGEFAFIIAQFGQNAGVTDRKLYPIVVAVSVITTFLTPYIMRLAEPTEQFLNSHLSEGTRLLLENYAQRRASVKAKSIWNQYLRKVATTVIVSSIVCIFIYILYFQYVTPFILPRYTIFKGILTTQFSHTVTKLIALALLMAITSPFLYNIVARHRMDNAVYELWNKGRGEKASIAGLFICRIIIGIAFISYALYRLFTITTGMVVGISIIFLLIITFSRRVRRQSRRLENGFNSNLTARETSAEDKRPMGKHFVTRLLPYDLHISDFTVPSDSTFSGKTLRELNLRQKSGVSVVRIIRAGIHTNIPGGSKHIYPGDRIVVAGTDEQIDKFKKMLDSNRHIEENPNTDRTHVTLESMVIESNSTLIGQTIQESGIREKAECLVMGIERNHEYIMNPEPTLTFEENDIILVAGETAKLTEFLNNINR